MVDPSQRKLSESMLLVDVAKRLRNERVDQVMESFREQRVSTIRVFVIGLFTLWTWFWVSGPKSQEVLVIDAGRSWPWISAFLVISLVWMLVLRLGYYKNSAYADIFGVVFNFLIVCVLMKTGFLLLITLGALLPFMSIAVSAVYSRRAFIASIIASVLILWISAPDGYWISRPAYALYALSLATGLPLMIARILNALRDVSVQAVVARDAQNRFISTMSHELRTPLNAIIGGAQLMDADRLEGDQKRLLETLTSNANALLRRVNEVLDVAAINGGRIALVEEPMYLGDVLQTVKDSCELQAQAKDVALLVAPCENYQGALTGDLGRIEQVLINLTANAIKFTASGGSVSVKIETTPVTTNARNTERVTCTVIDTGIGISENDKSKIFDAFHQVSAGEARIHGGVGLGLYIVKSISDLMRATLTVNDNPLGGTIFKWDIELPRVDGGDKKPTISALQALDNHRSLVPSMRCLVIEDNVSNVEIIEHLLRRAGHVMLSAKDGPSGLKMMRSENLDLVFLDLHMPGMTGWDVLDALALDPGMAKVPPIVILSADSDPVAASTASRKGVVAYLTKPISTGKLLSVLELGSAISQGTVVDEASTSGLKLDHAEVSLLAELRQLESRQSVHDYLHACLKGLDESIAAIDQAIEASSFNDVKFHAHAAKNVFRNLGLQEGVNACDTLTERVNRGMEFTAIWHVLRGQADHARTVIATEPEYA